MQTQTTTQTPQRNAQPTQFQPAASSERKPDSATATIVRFPRPDYETELGCIADLGYN
ncbi:MAG: hypothetical protein HYS20_10675 [Rhodocyclales bacterium]|nr:hypothetical protein [Rhodocyclales bacterium]